MPAPPSAPTPTPVDTTDTLATRMTAVETLDVAQVLGAEVTFTQTSAAGTYTGSVVVPAGATIIDIQVRSSVLWNAGTSSTMIVGDVADDNGWYDAINLQATDLLVGEVIKFGKSGGKEGAYLVQSSGLENTSYSASARTISGIITTVGTGTAGRSRMAVLWIAATPTAATKV